MSDNGSDLHQSHLDVSVLEQLAEDMDESIMHAVLEMFLADGQELTAKIVFLLASGDDDELAKAAHKLGGNTATCGQTGLSQILYDCETAIRLGDVAKGREHAQAFIACSPSGFDSLSKYIQNLKNKPD